MERANKVFYIWSITLLSQRVSVIQEFIVWQMEFGFWLFENKISNENLFPLCPFHCSDSFFPSSRCFLLILLLVTVDSSMFMLYRWSLLIRQGDESCTVPLIEVLLESISMFDGALNLSKTSQFNPKEDEAALAYHGYGFHVRSTRRAILGSSTTGSPEWGQLCGKMSTVLFIGFILSITSSFSSTLFDNCLSFMRDFLPLTLYSVVSPPTRQVER